MIKSSNHLKVLLLDAETGFYRIQRYPVGSFFGPVDLGIHLAFKFNSLTIGGGLFAGSIFPGSNRLVFTGISPCWHGFYVSTMGGAALVFDNLGINMLSIIGKSHQPSLLYLNRNHGEEIELELVPCHPESIWGREEKGVYAVMAHAMETFGPRYENDPRVLATGPAALYSDFGAVASAPVRKGQLSHVDTWAGRGGFGSKLLKEHGIVGVIYGGTHIDEDFKDRTVADQWFESRFNQRMSVKDMDATTKYRYDPKFNTGGTFGVNYATMGADILAFNYRTIYWSDEDRKKLHEEFIQNHYLKQFNEETIQTKQQRNCGEPCSALCKKMHGVHKKDYEPYQTMGPLCGIFDQRAAEKLNRHADTLGFDAISAGGILAWLMDCLDEGLIAPEDLGVEAMPKWRIEDFDVVSDSMHNSELGVSMLDQMVRPDGKINLAMGARKFARGLSRTIDSRILDRLVVNAFARQGWMVPNQYWTPGVLAPMAIMGKYYMHYGKDFLPPRELGRQNARRMLKELELDNMGFCRFHRAWAEDMLPEMVDKVFGCKDEFISSIRLTASRITSRNASVFWESERNIDMIYTFLKKRRQLNGGNNDDLNHWVTLFEKDKHSAAYEFWYDMHKGIHEILREFPC